MSFFDNMRVELAFRSLLTPRLSARIDAIEQEWNSENLSEARKAAMWHEYEDAMSAVHSVDLPTMPDLLRMRTKSTVVTGTSCKAPTLDEK